MESQVAFKLDNKLKNIALKKAKANGITLKAFYTYCTKAYITWELDLGIRLNEWGNEEEKAWEEAKKEIERWETLDGKEFFKSQWIS